MTIVDHIATGAPLAGRRIISRVGATRRGEMFKTRCLGVLGRRCGTLAVVAGPDLINGKAKRCARCAAFLRWTVLRSTPVGKEFVAARRRHRGK